MPPPEKPEKVRIDGLSWDGTTQQFVVSLSAAFGQATAGANAGFLVSTGLEIKDLTGANVGAVDPKDGGVQKQAGAVKDSDNMVKIEDQRIEWDRNGGSVAGDHNVTATSTLKNASGSPIGGSGGSSSTTKTINIVKVGDPGPAPQPD